MSTTTFIEKLIAREVIKTLLAAGKTLSVFDGEEVTLKRSTDQTAIEAAMFTTDEDYLLIDGPSMSQNKGWVRFIYGNDGWDVINDYSTNLEPILGPICGAEDTSLATRILDGAWATVTFDEPAAKQGEGA